MFRSSGCARHGVLLAWLGLRAWRTRDLLPRWFGAGAAALGSLIAISLGVLLILGYWHLRSRKAPPVTLIVANTLDQIRRGKAVADGYCGGCHSTTGDLTGGLDLGQHVPLAIGRLWPPITGPPGR
jgi:hypothetical protein